MIEKQVASRASRATVLCVVSRLISLTFSSDWSHALCESFLLIIDRKGGRAVPSGSAGEAERVAGRDAGVR